MFEQIKKDGTETGATAADKINSIIDYINTEGEMEITAPVIKTVAADGETNPENYDFASFEEAMTWAEGVDYMPGGWLYLNLADGVHYMERDPKQPIVGGNGMAAYNLNHVNLGFFGSGKDNCTLTFKPGAISGNYGNVIRAFAARLSFDSMTIDYAAGGHADNYPEQNFIRHDNCYIFFGNCNVYGFKKGAGHVTQSNTNSNVYSTEVTIRRFKSVAYFFGANITLYADVDECSYVAFTSSWIPTVNTVNLKITAGPDLDHIVFNQATGGGLDAGEFTDSILYHKGGESAHYFFGNWAGPTASRPTNLTKAAGQPYFDTELGKPIWFDGADWVDATGTVV